MEATSIYILKSAGLLSLFYLVYILLLKNDTGFQLNRKFLIIGIIASFIAPAAVFTKTIQVESQQLATENFIITEGLTESISTLPQEEPFNIWQIAGFIYLLGLSFFLIRFGFQLFSLLKIIRNQPKLKDSGITILHSEEAIPPFSFFQYIILNPKLHSQEELKIILQHEKIHAAQNHSADVLLANLTTAVLWFNPSAWFYKKNILQNLEFIADKETVAKNISRKQYQETLLKVCLANFQPALSNSFYQSFIKKRILMLHKKSTSNNLWKMTAVLPLVLAFLLVFNVKTVAQVKTSKEKTTVTKTEEYSVSISKNSSPKILESLKKFMLKQNVELDYENINRSPEGLLTSITVNFLNKTNNISGSVSKNDPDGISSFMIFLNKNGETGVADAPDFPYKIKNPQDKVLAEIGLNPLFIINKKEYQAEELYGKHIHLKSGFVFISPNDAEEIEKYGTKGKDGIILVAEGVIIADFSEEMKRVDLENKKTTLNYLQVVEGFKPTFITVTKNPKNLQKSQKNKNKSSEKDEKQEKAEKDTLKTKKNGIKMVIGTGARFEADKPGIGNILGRDSDDIYAYQKGSKSNPITSAKYLDQEKPLLVVDGEIKEAKSELNSIKTEEIASVNVLKGENAVKKYGEEANGGAVEISTKSTSANGSSKAFVAVLESSTNEEDLKFTKEQLFKQAGIEVNFKNIKRNKEGLITNIKITAKYKTRELGASFSETGGIPRIFVGVTNDQLVVSSNPPEMK